MKLTERSPSSQARRWREAVALENLDVPGHPLPRLHPNAPEPVQESVGLDLVVERGEGGDEDAAALDVAGDGLA